MRQNKRFLPTALISVVFLTAAHAQEAAPQVFEAEPIVREPDISLQAPSPGPLTVPTQAPPQVSIETQEDIGLNIDLDAIFNLTIEPQAQTAIDVVEEIFPLQEAEFARPSVLAPPVPSTTPYAQPDYVITMPDEETPIAVAYETPFGVMGGADGVMSVPVQPAADAPDLRLSALEQAPPIGEEQEPAQKLGQEPAQGAVAAGAMAGNDVAQDIAASELVTRTPRKGRFSLLNKVTGKVRPIELLLDEPLFVDDLSIAMFDCVSTPPEDPPETKAFLRVVETRKRVEELVFSGWMFASSPGLNGLEHPEYDLWPKACVGADGLVFTGQGQP